MNSKPAPSAEFLRECFSYNPDTGELFWNARPVSHFKSENACSAWNGRYANKPCGCIRPDGYVKTSVNKVSYLAHRIIWKMITGIDCEFIDHVNGVKSDNRISNLRDVTMTENNRNMTGGRDSDDAFIGVYWHRQRSKWMARIRSEDSERYIGIFDEIKPAVLAYNAECERLHGEYGKRKIEYNLNKLREMGLM
ncbi:HNH endonuclease [Escherichia coli]|uniref:HNH endonuclease n=1 Tax=Escherichia coli TaxID=562 RepID=UPI002ED3435E